MNELLAHPAVQSAAVPFFVALAIMLLFRRFGDVAFGLAIIGGLISTVLLTTGLSLQALTSTQKIILSSLCLPFIVLLIKALLLRLPVTSERWRASISIAIPAVMLVIAVNWAIWPVIQRLGIVETWPMLLKVSLYAGVIGVSFLKIARIKAPEKSVVQGASALALGMGTAITSMIAASALYAQLAFSVTAAVGGLLLIGLFAGFRQGVGYLSPFGLFAAAVPLALLGATATVYAQLPSWVLLCLAAVPLVTGYSRINIERPWLRLVCTNMLALLPVIPAVWLAWRAAGPISY